MCLLVRPSECRDIVVSSATNFVSVPANVMEFLPFFFSTAMNDKYLIFQQFSHRRCRPTLPQHESTQNGSVRQTNLRQEKASRLSNEGNRWIWVLCKVPLKCSNKLPRKWNLKISGSYVTRVHFNLPQEKCSVIVLYLSTRLSSLIQSVYKYKKSKEDCSADMIQMKGSASNIVSLVY